MGAPIKLHRGAGRGSTIGSGRAIAPHACGLPVTRGGADDVFRSETDQVVAVRDEGA
jgi:hypothetical protein